MGGSVERRRERHVGLAQRVHHGQWIGGLDTDQLGRLRRRQRPRQPACWIGNMSTMVCDVSGVPLWNVMSGRSVMVHTVRSSFASRLSARYGAGEPLGSVLHQRVVDRPDDVVAAGGAGVLPRTQTGRLGLETHDHRAAHHDLVGVLDDRRVDVAFGLRPVWSRRWPSCPRSQSLPPWCRPRSCHRSRTTPPRRRAPMESRVLSVPVAVACIPHLVGLLLLTVSRSRCRSENVAINTPSSSGRLTPHEHIDFSSTHDRCHTVGPSSC